MVNAARSDFPTLVPAPPADCVVHELSAKKELTDAVEAKLRKAIVDYKDRFAKSRGAAKK